MQRLKNEHRVTAPINDRATRAAWATMKIREMVASRQHREFHEALDII